MLILAQRAAGNEIPQERWAKIIVNFLHALFVSLEKKFRTDVEQMVHRRYAFEKMS